MSITKEYFCFFIKEVWNQCKEPPLRWATIKVPVIPNTETHIIIKSATVPLIFTVLLIGTNKKIQFLVDSGADISFLASAIFFF